MKLMPEALCPCPAGLGRDADRPARVNASLSPCPGGIRTSEAAVLPYVPYPPCLATGSLPAILLPVLQLRRTSQSGALVTDPITGIEVPVLAVTLHPQTRQWLTLGGTYRNPLTQTLAPLELGGPMEDPVTGGISTILGVGLDENTGLLAALVPSFCPSSLWSGFPSPSPQHPRSSTFWSSLQTLPQAYPYFHLHAPATFPLLPGFPHPHLQHSAPHFTQGGGQGQELSCFYSKSMWMFSYQERHSFSPCPPSPDSAPPPSLHPHPVTHSILAPRFSLLPHPPASLPASPSLWFLPPGQVLALGGLRDASGNLLLPGDSFVEPLSRKLVRLQGASRQEGRTVPHTGGPQDLLDANVLVAQRRVIAVLRSSQEMPGLRGQGLLEAAVKDMRQALALSLHHLLQQAWRLQRQQKAAENLEASGGRIGTAPQP